jgi:methyl-accepting chemotaxis protein PixJ
MTRVPFKPTSPEMDQDAANLALSQTPDPSQIPNSSQTPALSADGSEADPIAPTNGAIAKLGDRSGESEPASGTKRSGQSLQRQLLQTILPLALTPLIVGSVVTYWITEHQSQARMNQNLEGQSLLANKTISQNIVDELSAAAALADSPLFLDRVRIGSRAVDAENLKLNQRTINEIDDKFAQTKLLEPDQSFNDYLRRVAETEGLKEILVTEKNGLNVGFTTSPSSLVQSQEEWWQQGKAQTQWISNPTYDESGGGGFGINLSQKIQDPENGDFLGVIKVFVSAVKFKELSKYFDQYRLQGSQKLQILDVSLGSALVGYTAEGQKVPESYTDRLKVVGGSTVMSLAKRIVQLDRAEHRSTLAAIQRELQAAYPVENLVVTQGEQVDKRLMDAESLMVSFTYQGKQYAMSVLPKVDWVSIASMDTVDIRAESQDLLSFFAWIALALAGIATLAAIKLSRQLSAPLNELSTKAQQVSTGDLEVTVEPRGSWEAQTLAQTFNTLVFRVKGLLREQTLTARQATLAAKITGAKVVSLAELPALFDSVVAEARNILETDRVVIYRFNPDWSSRIVAESVADNLPSAYQQQLNDPCIPPTAYAKCLAEGMFLANAIAAADPQPEHLTLLRELQVKSILSVPVMSQGHPYGLLIAHHCTAAHQWQPAEEEFFKQLGLQLGLVIERLTLLEQTRDLAEEQRQTKEGLQRNAIQLLMDVDPVSQGNLTARAKVTEDEIGTVADSYNATIASLRKIVVQVQSAAGQVAETTATNQLSVSALSAAAAQQATEIVNALERAQEMADSVKLVAANAEKAETAVQQAAQTVQAGDNAMNRTVESILAIRQTVADTAKKVKRLGESSQKIYNVVNLISGFAAQTNMLALNASIEASRAGEGGKGFAVVAEEVRGLARQSAEATTEIEKLVASIQTETNEVMMAMESGTEQVVTGTKLVDETRQSLNQIAAASLQISALVESIAQATIVQTKASETVTDNMTTVAAIASQNSTAANQVSESFEQLRSVAQALQAEVGRFTVQ